MGFFSKTLFVNRSRANIDLENWVTKPVDRWKTNFHTIKFRLPSIKVKRIIELFNELYSIYPLQYCESCKKRLPYATGTGRYKMCKCEKDRREKELAEIVG
jgi:hypothetical protein